MPNWCMNRLSVSGQADELKNFVLSTQGLPAKYPPQEWEKNKFFKVQDPTEPQFCFNALIPTPEPVLRMGYDAHDKIPKDTLQRILAGKPVEPIDGYHWNIQNWGTKWDVYYDNITPETMGWSEGCEMISFEFDTAWSPPRAWFETVVEKFPMLSFELHYEEPGCYFAGDIFGGDGLCTYDEYDDERCAEVFEWMEEDEIIIT